MITRTHTYIIQIYLYIYVNIIYYVYLYIHDMLILQTRRLRENCGGLIFANKQFRAIQAPHKAVHDVQRGLEN